MAKHKGEGVNGVSESALAVSYMFDFNVHLFISCVFYGRTRQLF